MLRNVLVTGGTGFIGSHLVRRLSDLGANVSVMGRHGDFRDMGEARFSFLPMDLAQDDITGTLEVGRFDVIFHLAANSDIAASVANPKLDFSQNALATLNLTEAVRTASPDSRLVYASSALVYWGEGMLPETHPTRPATPYAASKLAAEDVLRQSAVGQGLNIAVARLFSVYGPHLRRQLVYDIVKRLRDEPASITMRGSGHQMRDLIYVDDVVAGLLTIAEKGTLAGEIYNLGTERGVPVHEVVSIVAGHMGLEPDVRYDYAAAGGDTPTIVANTSKLQGLGFQASVALEEGLRCTVAWNLAQPRAR